MPTLFSKPKQQAASAPTGGAGGAGPAKPLFNAEQIAKATKDYSSAGGAKWNQIMAGMGAGGGTGGDFSKAIETQAATMGSKLGELTDQSGFGSDPGQAAQIMKQLEGGIGAQYPVY